MEVAPLLIVIQTPFRFSPASPPSPPETVSDNLQKLQSILVNFSRLVSNRTTPCPKPNPTA
jgi:hypothetical protein